jgi:predicted O-methyltransferase YrrM
VLHARIDAPWPCDASQEFSDLWESLSRIEPIAEAAVEIDHDADPALLKMVWCLVRHLQPRVVVETGVSRGITSRVILEALARNGEGHLWSIDLPPLDEPWRSLVGSAVSGPLRARWTYVRGSSRRRLPAVSRRVGPIDLFIHDSLHTPENLRFELGTVWPHLRPGAGVVIDDAVECAAVDVLTRFGHVPLLAVREERKQTFAGFATKDLQPSGHEQLAASAT